jgi:quercetin dioxygenase-like cupin family protein
MKLPRIFANSDGQSCWGETEVEFNWVDYAPPAPPMGATDPSEAEAYVFLQLPPEWDGGMHNTPMRQIAVILSGKVEIETSGGEVQEFGAGEVFLMEDTTGVGHTARNTGENELAVVMIHLP